LLIKGGTTVTSRKKSGSLIFPNQVCGNLRFTKNK
jgi:hypothetical protein